VIWEILGVPEDQREECAAWAQATMRHFGQPESRNMGDSAAFTDASLRLTRNLALMLAEAVAWSALDGQGGHPYKGKLIGEIARRTMVPIDFSSQNAELRTLEFTESLMTLVQFVLASMSMQFLMGTALRNFLKPAPGLLPAQRLPWHALRNLRNQSPAAFQKGLDRAFEEVRRIDPPVTIVQRFAGEGVQLHGVNIPKDCPVFFVVAAANCDSIVGPNPTQFQWDRPNVQQVSLGHGVHECIGRAVQSWVVPPAIVALLDKMPDLQLCDTGSTPAWLDNIYFRTLLSLPVHRCPAALPAAPGPAPLAAQ
jgi:cytochrome P450